LHSEAALQNLLTPDGLVAVIFTVHQGVLILSGFTALVVGLIAFIGFPLLHKTTRGWRVAAAVAISLATFLSCCATLARALRVRPAAVEMVRLDGEP
jgi:hypothetical protein